MIVASVKNEGHQNHNPTAHWGKHRQAKNNIPWILLWHFRLFQPQITKKMRTQISRWMMYTRPVIKYQRLWRCCTSEQKTPSERSDIWCRVLETPLEDPHRSTKPEAWTTNNNRGMQLPWRYHYVHKQGSQLQGEHGMDDCFSDCALQTQ